MVLTERDDQARTPWLPLALIALPPALIAVLQLGRLQADEVYQALEPAQHFAFGGGELAWEWHEGLRNWAVAGAFGLVLKACGALGIDDPQLRRAVLELPQYALHLAALAAVYRLVRRRMGQAAAADPHAQAFALAGVLLVAWHAPVLHFAGRTLSESISTPFLLWGLERADLREMRARVYQLAGALLGLAVVARYGSAVIVLGALFVLAAQRRGRDLLHVVVGGCVIALLLAILDFATWGKPFHSLFKYLEFNVLSNGASESFGRQPCWFYLRWLALGIAPWVWPALLYALRRRREGAPSTSALFAASALLYLLALSCTAHKEVRFLYPAIVLLSACAAPAWATLIADLARRARDAHRSRRAGHTRTQQAIAGTVLVLSLASGLGVLAFDTHFEPRGGEQFRLYVEAVRHGQGVLLLHCGSWAAPGAFYAAGHPYRLCGSPKDKCTRKTLRSPKFDRIVGWEDEGSALFRRHGFVPLERQGSVVLWGRVQ